MAEHAWTVDEACRYFADGGAPVDPARLRMVIRALRWRPVGETPPGGKGGRGQAMYPIADFLQLHKAVAPWLSAHAED